MSFQTTDQDIAYVITLQFIDEKPSEVEFRRRTKVTTPAGGWKFNETAIGLKQRIRLVPGAVYADTVRTTIDGREIHPTFTLVAVIDANVEKYDLFTLDDEEYEVVWVEKKVIFQRLVGEVWKHG